MKSLSRKAAGNSSLLGFPQDFGAILLGWALFFLGMSFSTFADDLVIEAVSAPDSKIPSPLDASLLGFDEAINQIVLRSTAVLGQKANLGAVHERNRPVGLFFFPDLVLDAKRNWTGIVGQSDEATGYQVEAVSQLNLFKGGADYAALLAARADERTQQALLSDTYLRAESDAVNAVIGEMARKREIEVLSGIVKMQADSLAVSQQRYAGGYLPLQEVEKVSIDLSNAKARLADAQVHEIEASAALEALLGSSRISTEWPWKDRFKSSSSGLQTSFEATGSQLMEMLSRRPDWISAQERVEAEDQRVKRGWRLLAPSLDASLSYGYYGGNDFYGGTRGTAWQGALTLSLPIFDRLSNYSGAKAQSYVRTAAEAQFEQIRRDAKSDWESATKTFETALASAVARDQTLELSRKLYQDNLKRFQGGRINANDLILDQNRLYDSELFAVQGWSAVHLAFARKCKAQGLRLKDCR